MDLNLLYAQHQHSLMHAHASGCATHRASHLAKARVAALRIAVHQQRNGASAAAGWQSAAA
jgi:hypothetical protein